MSTETDREPTSIKPDDGRLADLRRRRSEAAAVLAETLLDIWLRARRAGRESALREPSEGGRSV